jgi:alkylhydroperoxidase/carboxymuconolactone decarboxylase family protein YurZ
LSDLDIDQIMAEIERQWSPMPDFKCTFNKMYKADPDLVKRFYSFAMTTLDPIISGKLTHLIYLGVDIIVTHLLPYGGREHVRMALEEGASIREIVETMGIVAFAGTGGYEVAFPIVRKVSAGRNGKTQSGRLTSGQETLKEKLSARMGYWPGWMDDALALTPEYLKSLIELAYPEPRPDGLDPKSRELILYAMHACPALNHVSGMERHAERALIHGATEQELIAVTRLANVIGCHSICVGFEAASEHLAKDVGGTRVARMWLAKPES